MRPLVLLCAAAALAGCAHAPRVGTSQPSSASTRPCDAPEYVTQARRDGEVTMDVEVSDGGHALRVVKTNATGLTEDQIGDALLIVRHAFHCRNRLPRNAPRIIAGYKLRYVAEMQGAGVDPEICGQAARYPAAALRVGAQRFVLIGVMLDEHGTVEGAWPIKPVDPYGFTESAIDALLHSCRFTPARLDDEPVPFFLVYRFNFVIARSHDESPL